MTQQPGKREVVIRKYEKEDHDKVCQLFYSGVVETWLPAYRQSLNMKFTLPTLIQIIQLATVFHYLSFPAFILAQLFIQALIMSGYFYVFWAYTR